MMRVRRVSSLLLKHLVLASALLGLAASAHESSPPIAFTGSKPAGAITAGLQDAYGRLPLQFEANRGQADPQVQYLSRGQGYSLFLTATEATLVLNRPSHQRDRGAAGAAVIGVRPVGANPAPHVAGHDELAGKANYFVGNDRSRWRTNIPTYAQVQYKDVYPGIDLLFYGNQRQLEYDFVLAPGADPGAIRLALTGTGPLALDQEGNLTLQAGSGNVLMRAPSVYQEINGARQDIGGRYVIDERSQVGFQVAAYDATLPLVIDPVLVYSTYLGGSGSDSGNGIAVDAAGNAYVTGTTASPNFPAPGTPLQTAGGGLQDVFVAKLNATGSALVYSTYLGGSDNDVGIGIVVDAAGNAYVTGSTASTNFPTLVPIQPALGDTSDPSGGDAFVAVLDPTGGALVFSTYLGGKGEDIGQGIAVDSSGNVYVTGATSSSDFPTANALQSAFGGAASNPAGGDAFVTKLNANGSAFVYSTYLGGSEDDFGTAIAVDSSGNAYVTGLTLSNNFISIHAPTLSGFQMTHGNLPTPTTPPPADGFMVKLNPNGATVLYSTFLGGADVDQGLGIALDASGNAYVTGFTLSSNFPTTAGTALQTAFGGGVNVGDAFVTKINTALSGAGSLIYSTYLGGLGEDYAQGIAVDSTGKVYVTGTTTTSTAGFQTPLTPIIKPSYGGSTNPLGGDAFVAKIDPALGAGGLIYRNYLGGAGDDSGLAIAVDASGNAYVTGTTTSTGFPTARPLQAAHGGGLFDAFIAKIAGASNPDLLMTLVSGPARGGQGLPIAVTTTVENHGAAAAGPFTVGIYLSTDSTITTGDTLLGTCFPVPSLAIGASSTATTTVTIPALPPPTPGLSYYLGAIADCGNAVVELDENNNTLASSSQILITQPLPDFVVNSVAVPGYSAPGKSFTVTNTVKNLGPKDDGTSFTVGLYLSANTTFDGTDTQIGSRPVASLAAGASSTDTTLVTVPGGTALGKYYILAVADPDPVSTGVVLEVDDTVSNNTGIAPTQITITQMPDLTVPAVSGPSTGSIGQLYSVVTTVENDGPADAGAFTVNLYLSTDPVITTTDTLITTLNIASLAGGARLTRTDSVTIPAVTPGTFFLGAIVDPDPTACPPGGPGAVAELNECNNTRAATSPVKITAFQPDFVMSVDSATGQGLVKDISGTFIVTAVGQTLTVGTTVSNKGPADSGAFTVGLYLSTNGVFDGGDTLLGNVSVPAVLAAGASSKATTTVTVSGVGTGTYFLLAVADPGGVVAEVDETNNTKAADNQVKVTPFQPDLVMDFGPIPIIGQPTGPTTFTDVGRVMEVSTVVTNAGPKASGPFQLGLYLANSPSATVAPSDVQLPPVLPGPFLLNGPSLAPGTSWNATTNVIIDPTKNVASDPALLGAADFNGYIFVKAIVDPNNSVAEFDETNNIKVAPMNSLSFIDPLPQLKMGAVTGPQKAGPGSVITVTGAVSNGNPGAAAGSFTVGLYISTSLSNNPAVINGDPITYIPLGRLMSLPNLAAGGSSSASVKVPLPANLPAATTLTNWNLIAVADPIGAVNEFDKTDNIKSSPIKIALNLPDLHVTSAAGPINHLGTPGLPGVPGPTIDVSTDVKNEGPVKAGAFTVGFYLSSNQTFDAGDRLLGSKAVAVLDVDQSTHVSGTFAIPMDLVPAPGATPTPWFLIAVADPDPAVTAGCPLAPGVAAGVMPELDECNNIQADSTAIQVSLPKPEFEITSVSGPLKGSPGQPLTITTLVKNDGPVKAPDFTVGLYLSATTTPNPATDRFLGAQVVTGLAPDSSATRTLSTTVTIPADITPETSYYLGAVADPNGLVPELTGLKNNKTAGSQTLITKKPDFEMTAVSGPPKGVLGQPYDVSTTVTNKSPAKAGQVTVALYLSGNNTIDPVAVDPILNAPDRFLQNLTVKSLAGNAASIDKTTITIPPDVLPGTYFLGAIVDPAPAPCGPGNPGSVVELDECNNVIASAQSITIISSKPDLVATNVTGPITGYQGQSVSVSTTVENKGPTDAGAFTVGIYLSTDNVINPATATLLGSRTVSSLAAGASSATTTTFTIPALIAPGSYSLGMVADTLDVVNELDETNNALASGTALSVTPFLPDLSITAGSLACLSPACPQTIGQIHLLSTTVQNIGPAGTATAFTVAYYLSAGINFDPAVDTFLGSRVINGLAAGALSTATTSVTIPNSVLPGNYFLVAVVDPGNVVVELDEAHNVSKSASLLVFTLSKPDLSVTAASFASATTTQPAAGILGQPVAVSVTVKNTGKLATPASTVGLYLSPVGVPNPSSAGFLASSFDPITGQALDPIPKQHRFLGTLNVAALAPGVSASVSGSVTIPADIPLSPCPPGLSPPVVPAFQGCPYFLGAYADPPSAALPHGAVDELDESNNGWFGLTFINIIPLLPDLTVGLVGGPPTGFPGQTVTVTAPVKNQGPAAAGSFPVKVYLTQKSTLDTNADRLLGSILVPGLASAGTAPVSGTVVIPPDVPPGAYFLEMAADPPAPSGPQFPNGVVVELDETNNNGQASPITITPFKPDLVVTAVSGPARAIPGQALAVSTSVTNKGPSASVASTVGLYLSPGAVVDPAKARFLGKGNVGALATGASATVATTVTIPLDVVPGTYFLGAIADSGTSVSELDYTNNSLASSNPTEIVAFLPDLAMQTVKLHVPGNVFAGKPVAVDSTVQNIGPAPSGTFTVGLYLSDGTVIDPARARFLGSRTASLAANAVSTVTTTVTIPPDVAPGAYFLGAVADAAQAVSEVDETNNAVSSAVTVQAFKPDLKLPDLSFQALPGSPGGSPGQPLSVSNSVTNVGPAPAGTFTVSLYLSTHDKGIKIDPATDRLLGSRSLALATQASSSVVTPVTIPSDVIPGNYFILGMADSAMVIDELDETNNVNSAPVQIIPFLPDLQVTQLSGPPLGVPGKTLTLPTTVTNSGPKAAGAFTVKLYLSTDSVIDPTPITGDTLLGSRSVTSLAVNATSSGSTTVTIPLTTPPGSYFLGAVVDPPTALLPNGAVAELIESNNDRAIPIVVTTLPDFVITAVTGPAQGFPGQTITMSATVRNQGPVAAGAFKVGLYLSDDAIVTTADTPLLATPLSVTGLAAGASVTLSNVAVTIPALTPLGSHFLGAVADPAGLVAEMDETNNAGAASGAIQITPNLPDLTVTSVAGPTSGTGVGQQPLGGAVGQPFKITTQVANGGPKAAGAFKVQLYLSSDKVFDPGDTPLLVTPLSVTGLAAGASVTLPPATVTIPGSPAITVPGSYYLIAVADPPTVVPLLPNGAVTEIDETNNDRASTTAVPITLFQPDLAIRQFSSPPEGFPGKPLSSVTAQVENHGPKASGTFTVGVYLGSSLSPVDPTVALQVGHVTLGLAAGAISTVTIPVTIPANQALNTYNLAVFADPAALPCGPGNPGAVPELDECNNAVTNSIVISGFLPDLVISSVTGPAQGASGHPITMTPTVTNQGPGPSTTFMVGLYLSGDGVFDPTVMDPILGTPDILLGSRTVSSLASGASSSGPTLVNVPAVPSSGTYFLYAVADSNNQVNEGPSEGNNIRGTGGSIQVTSFLPDLVMTAVSGPDSAALGQPLTVATIVENRGLAPTAVPFGVSIYLSPDNNVSPINPAATLLGTRTVPILAAGAVSSAPMTITAVPPPAGFVPNQPRGQNTYYLIAVADPPTVVPLLPNGAVIELVENNNTVAAQSKITLTEFAPDLVLTAVRGPAVGLIGQSINVINTVVNRGPAPAGLFNVGLYLSDPRFPEKRPPIAANDILLTNRAVTSLAAGAGPLVTTPVTIPLTVPPGIYHLGAFADLAGSLGEFDVTNNALGSVAEITIVHNLQGAYTGSGALNGAGCLNPIVDGNSVLTTTTFTITSQTALAFTGTATISSSAPGGNRSTVETLSIIGGFDSPSAISGSFTISSATKPPTPATGVFLASGNGTFTGTVSLTKQLTLSFAGQDTKGASCQLGATLATP